MKQYKFGVIFVINAETLEEAVEYLVPRLDKALTEGVRYDVTPFIEDENGRVSEAVTLPLFLKVFENFEGNTRFDVEVEYEDQWPLTFDSQFIN